MQVPSARRGMTLVELLVVVVLIGFTVIPFFLTYNSYRSNQALVNSAEQLANNMRAVHIFSREAREQKEWGIKNTNSAIYSIFSSGASGVSIIQQYPLEVGVSFARDFEILFQIGTGETETSQEIELINRRGSKVTVTISQTGVVGVGPIE